MAGETDHERIVLLAIASSNSCIVRLAEDMLQRNWAVCTARPLPEDIKDWSTALNLEAQEFLRRELAAYHSQAEIDAGRFSAQLLSVDTHHVVLRTTAKASGLFGSGPRVAVEYHLLQSMDRTVQIEDLQGYPRRFWPLVFPPVSV
jgi:hypothetical protein